MRTPRTSSITEGPVPVGRAPAGTLRPARRVASALGILGLLLIESHAPARADEQETAAAQSFARELKRMQCVVLHQGAARKRLEVRAAHRRGSGSRPTEEAALRPASARPAPPRVRAIAADRRLNDRASDLSPSATQSEVSIAALGSMRVAAWNDREVRFAAGEIGFAWSRDDGATWTDGGVPPLSDKIIRWVADPVVAVNEKTGTFYLCGMAIATNPPANAIAVARGRFTDAGFAWDPPVAVRSSRDTLPDKPWMAADSLSGNVYVTYTGFAGTDWIDLQRSSDDGASWSPPLKLSSARDEGLVQGSRPAVGPDGEVYVVWGAVDTTEASRGLDWKRLRRSDDFGASFGEEATVTGLYANFGSGAPGFNKGNGFDFPGIAVDRSSGLHRGRVYVVWQEGLNYYDDYPSAAGAPVLEVETAPPAAAPFAVGDLVRGAISRNDDVDTFRFTADRGQTVIFYVDSLDRNLDLKLQLLCGDGLTRIAYNAPSWRGRPRTVFATLPVRGAYVLRLEHNQPSHGGYRVRTGWVGHGGERARDHRDVFVAHSDDGSAWSEPVRVNQGPPYYDDWLPEIAVSARGGVYVAWYDWRGATVEPCALWSQTLLARSDDGGDHWTELGPVSGAPTSWSDVTANLIPNQGDYIALFANDRAVEIAWADGRDGDPDVWAASLDLADQPLPVPRGTLAIARVRPNPASREVTIELALGGVAATRLELVDVNGRRWRTATLAAGAGRRDARFALDRTLPNGIYWVRATQDGRVATARFALVR